MAERRWPEERWKTIAEELIAKEPKLRRVRESDASIAYLSSDAAKKSHGKVVRGICEKVPSKWRWSLPFDFTITIFEPNVADLDEARLRRLVYHELLHVGIDHDEDGEEKYSIVPHDVEDFREMVDRFGIDWALEEAAG